MVASARKAESVKIMSLRALSKLAFLPLLAGLMLAACQPVENAGQPPEIGDAVVVDFAKTSGGKAVPVFKKADS